MTKLQSDTINAILAVWAATLGGLLGYLFTHKDIVHQFLGGVFQIM